MSFLGTQPRITQVPPRRCASTSATRAPWLAAMRAARTPPEPPPTTTKSNSRIIAPSAKVGGDDDTPSQPEKESGHGEGDTDQRVRRPRGDEARRCEPGRSRPRRSAHPPGGL